MRSGEEARHARKCRVCPTQRMVAAIGRVCVLPRVWLGCLNLILKKGKSKVKQANTVTHLTTDSFTIPPCRAPKPDTKAWCTAMMK